MKLEERIILFSELGNYILENLDSEEFEQLFLHAKSKNAWFTLDNIQKSIRNIAERYLNKVQIDLFVKKYPKSFFKPNSPKNLGIIAAGNIPLVGFQDFIHGVLSGHKTYIKPSSQDTVLIGFLIKKMLEFNPKIADYVQLADKLNGMDAYIATGSGNTSRYFEYYFGQKPNIIRKNRISVAVLSGNETNSQLSDLGSDIFSYFGLGCRNVSKIFVPEGYNFEPFFKAIEYWNTITLHSKYLNNYDYNKSIFLVNGDAHLDNGFLLVKESQSYHSPISTLFYETYSDISNVPNQLKLQEENLQCIVSSFLPDTIPFGKTQSPELWDFADNVDTLKFLAEI